MAKAKGQESWNDIEVFTSKNPKGRVPRALPVGE